MEQSIGIPQGFTLDPPSQQPQEVPQGFVLDPIEQPQITGKGFLPKDTSSLDIIKAFGTGALNVAQKAGTGIAQLAQELGSDVFANIAKQSAKLVAPELSEEIDKYTPQEVTDLITQASKQQVEQRIAGQEEKGLGLVTRGAELGTEIAALPVGRGIASVAGAIGLEAGLQPVEVGEGLGERAKQTAIGAGIGFGIGSVAKMASGVYQTGKQAIKGALHNKTYTEMGETAVKLKQKASDVYDAMRKIDATITKRASVRIGKTLDNTLQESGKLNKRLHGDTLSVIDDIKKVAKDKALGIEELDQYRQLLNQVSMKNTDLAGHVNADGLKARILIEKLDNVVDNLKPIDLTKGGEDAVQMLNQARGDWKTFKKYQKILDVVEKAGDDPNRIKSAFQRFVTNKKNLLGYTAEEKKALMSVAENTSGEKILKTLGKFGIDLGTSLTPGNTFLPAASVFAGSLSGSAGTGIAFAGAGTVARKAQKLIASGKITDALKIIEQGGMGDIAGVIKTIPSKEGQKMLLSRILGLTITGELE
jgi:hypothetical protein